MNNKIKQYLLEQKVFALNAENEKLKANQDYIAMMTDVEIPEEERGGYDESEIR